MLVGLTKYPGYYLTEKGEVYSTRQGKLKRLKPIPNNKGYLRVNLYDRNGKQKWNFVHRLVASVFIPNKDGLPEVNHIDRNPLNCDISNLEWCDRTYNVNYMKDRDEARERMLRIIAEHPGMCSRGGKKGCAVKWAKYYAEHPKK